MHLFLVISFIASITLLFLGNVILYFMWLGISDHYITKDKTGRLKGSDKKWVDC